MTAHKTADGSINKNYAAIPAYLSKLGRGEEGPSSLDGDYPGRREDRYDLRQLRQRAHCHDPGEQFRIPHPNGDRVTADGNFVTKQKDARGNEVVNSVDANGKVLSVTDPAGQSVGYTYDNSNRVTNGLVWKKVSG